MMRSSWSCYGLVGIVVDCCCSKKLCTMLVTKTHVTGPTIDTILSLAVPKNAILRHITMRIGQSSRGSAPTGRRKR